MTQENPWRELATKLDSHLLHLMPRVVSFKGELWVPKEVLDSIVLEFRVQYTFAKEAERAVHSAPQQAAEAAERETPCVS